MWKVNGEFMNGWREVIDFEDKNGFSVNKSQKECYIKAVNCASIQEKILNA